MDNLANREGAKPRILFWGEELALSHVVRPLVLADSVRDRYEVIFVTGERYSDLVASYGFKPRKAWTLSSDLFMERLSKGKDCWEPEEISRQVKDELALIDELSPDLIVGDLRWSLGTSAELTKTPYISIVNAYWAPYCTLPVPTPEFPFVKLIGVKLSAKLMPLLAPTIFKKLAKPFNAVRREHGLQMYGEYRDIAAHADWVVYPDLPVMAPTENLPGHHRYLGAVQWSPTSEYPSWWNHLPHDKPLIYLSMGSTGRAGVAETLIDALGELPVTVMLATSKRLADADLPPNIYSADYLPGIESCGRSDLVICNGGAGSVYQAITGKTPVIGIPTNPDQYYVSDALTQQGGGTYLRSTHVTKQNIKCEVDRVLSGETYVDRIEVLHSELVQFDPVEQFNQVIELVLNTSVSGSAFNT
jgi:UDP:flavonoid glycosyltransferase YjiC (YdhE family)